MAQLTEAGFKMIGAYLDHKAYVESSKPVWSNSGCFNARKQYSLKDGRIFMSLSVGSGQEAATVRKLVREGFAEGAFNWGSRSTRWMVPTEAGLAAYYDELLQRKHERDLRSMGEAALREQVSA